ncbi:hypothetical protein N0V93_005584 [Gnomoniopsis smithogilvyi]|uniref:SAM-dependent MTase RsmB/NOP-type domain-containing protein n=1 Tax=Gnomoniopsis smithogilvyi TaxID=1191159 RepID=A0A9W8YWW4_9PEZI|nr:hypothetical protein N0V93_005584 [Gnomoniopsis smithogilvyi]
MSLYHETASVLDTDASTGGNLRSRVFNRKDLKSPPTQVYALALETCKWSPVLSEIIDNSQLLQHEKKLTPILSLLLVHDFLLAKGGIALPASHGLRSAVERHKSRLTAEFTRTRIRRKCSSVAALTEHVEAALYANSQHPRWIRINTLKSSIPDQLTTTFQDYSTVDSVHEVLKGPNKLIYVDEHIPNLVAVSPRFDFARCEAYKSGALILQDKASCFPAYLLDPQPKDGDAIDGCAAPGNKTTHLAAIIGSHKANSCATSIHAFERDEKRAKTLERMVKTAGSDDFTHVHAGQDFLKVDPSNEQFSNVGTILLDPSCSGSGIVGRDDMPELHLPTAPSAKVAGAGKGSKKAPTPASKKRKRQDEEQESEKVLIDDDGNTTVVASEKDLQSRLEALSSFQLNILLHAFSFPAARKITYSTCSIHAEENEQVVIQALRSNIARQRGWRILPREAQVNGMKTWPIRGHADAADGDSQVADACIRAHKDDGRGVMGFFVAAFERDPLSSPAGRGTESASSLGKAKCNQTDAGSVSRSSDIKDRPNANGANGEGVEMADGGDESEWSGFDD